MALPPFTAGLVFYTVQHGTGQRGPASHVGFMVNSIGSVQPNLSVFLETFNNNTIMFWLHILWENKVGETKGVTEGGN